MLSQTELKDIFPIIITPSYDGKIFFNNIVSLLNFQDAARKIGMPNQYLMMQGISSISHARNSAVATFLSNPDWTHLFWVDADIGFSVESALRLLQSDYEIAAGVYPHKSETWPAHKLAKGTTYADFLAQYQNYTINARVQPDQPFLDLEILDNGFMEMGDVPTGFMVIKRSVFEKLMKHYPELRYRPSHNDADDNGCYYRFYDTTIDPKSNCFLTEDFSFCRLWEAIGGKIYIDATSDLSHQGMKMYHGNLPEALRTNFSQVILAKEGLPMMLYGVEHLDP